MVSRRPNSAAVRHPRPCSGDGTRFDIIEEFIEVNRDEPFFGNDASNGQFLWIACSGGLLEFSVEEGDARVWPATSTKQDSHRTIDSHSILRQSRKFSKERVVARVQALATRHPDDSFDSVLVLSCCWLSLRRSTPSGLKKPGTMYFLQWWHFQPPPSKRHLRYRRHM